MGKPAFYFRGIPVYISDNLPATVDGYALGAEWADVWREKEERQVQQMAEQAWAQRYARR